MMEIYVFECNDGEEDFVLAPSMKEAKEHYLKASECGSLDTIKVKPLHKQYWKSLSIMNEKGETETFEEYALKNNETKIFATTDF